MRKLYPASPGRPGPICLHLTGFSSAVPTMKPIATQVVEKLTQSPTNSTSLTAIATATKPAGPTATKPASPIRHGCAFGDHRTQQSRAQCHYRRGCHHPGSSATATATPDPGDPKTAGRPPPCARPSKNRPAGAGP